MHCPWCGKAIPENARFCGMCGKKIPEIRSLIDEEASSEEVSNEDLSKDLPASVGGGTDSEKEVVIVSSDDDKCFCDTIDVSEALEKGERRIEGYSELVEDGISSSDSAESQNNNDVKSCDFACASSDGDDEGESQNIGKGESNSSASERRRIPKTALIASVIVVVALIVLIVLVATGVLFSKPQLSDEQITGTIQERDWSTEYLTSSEWGTNDGYTVESMEILSNEEEPGLSVDDPEMRCARVQIVLSNPSFRVTLVSGERFRRLEDNSWEHFDTVIESVSSVPIGPIDDERLIASVPTFLQSIDDADKGSHNDNLLDLYGEGASFEIIENGTGAQGGSVQIGLSRDGGLYTCAGTLTVSFAYSDGDWTETSCVVDESAYQKDYSAMLGEHAMMLAESTAAGGKCCYGARSIPASFNVKSYDPSGNTITADVTFAVHNHNQPDNAVESCEGDASFTAKDVIVKLSFSSLGTEVLDKKDVVGSADVDVVLTLEEDSSVADLVVYHSCYPRGIIHEGGSFQDYYTIDFSK